MLDLRDIINARLAELGWSQARLAREAGLPQSVVNQYLGGLKDTSSARASAMLRAMGASKILWRRP